MTSRLGWFAAGALVAVAVMLWRYWDEIRFYEAHREEISALAATWRGLQQTGALE